MWTINHFIEVGSREGRGCRVCFVAEDGKGGSRKHVAPMCAGILFARLTDAGVLCRCYLDFIMLDSPLVPVENVCQHRLGLDPLGMALDAINQKLLS